MDETEAMTAMKAGLKDVDKLLDTYVVLVPEGKTQQELENSIKASNLTMVKGPWARLLDLLNIKWPSMYQWDKTKFAVL